MSVEARRPCAGSRPATPPFNNGENSPYQRLPTRAVAAKERTRRAVVLIGVGMASEYEDRRRLTFEQAEGAEPMPSQLALREVSPELRARLWAIFQQELAGARGAFPVSSVQSLEGPIVAFLYYWHVACCFRAADELTSSYNYWINELKPIFMEGDYLEIFGFVQRVLRHDAKPYDLEIAISDALRASRAAYSVFDGDTIIPIGSDAERETLARAFADLAASEFHGARTHLRNAGSELTGGSYGPSIRESIHAVEAVARVLEPSANTLAPALSKLAASVRIHPALRSGFSSLYGFTNDEEGVRHPLVDEPVAKVDETDALYMLGSSAAFVSYLINKVRQAGLLNAGN